MSDTRNTILAVVLSGLVLLVWQYFYVVPTEKKREQTAQTQVINPPAQTNAATPATGGGSAPPAAGSASAPAAPQAAPGSVTPAQPTTTPQSREAALAASPRVKIDSPAISGSISLRGARIDDLALKQFRETVDPNSPPIVLLEPAGTASTLLRRVRLGAGGGAPTKAAGPEHDLEPGQRRLAVAVDAAQSVVDNGEGLVFHRTIAVDELPVHDQGLGREQDHEPVTLYPTRLISLRHAAQVAGYMLHEGIVGVVGDKLQEIKYKDIDDKKLIGFRRCHRQLVRHHRQILGHGAAAEQ